MGKLIDLSGQRFGRLLVGSYAGLDGGKNASWNCLCDCGISCVVRGAHMRDGSTASCGCLVTNSKARIGVRRGDGSLGKGDEHRAMYATWTSMRARCGNADHPSFFRYGGRGISVCTRWDSFELFLADVGPRPFAGAELDRIDNSLGYEPDNVRWSSTKENSRNRRSARLINTPMGEMPVWRAVEVSGLSNDLLRARVYKKWPVERLFEPPQFTKRGEK